MVYLPKEYPPQRVRTYTSFSISIGLDRPGGHFEVRFFADGYDLIKYYWDRAERDLIGMDPDDLLLDPSPLLTNTGPCFTRVARCNCSYALCDNVEVEISRDGNDVIWRQQKRKNRKIWMTEARFPADVYDEEIKRAMADTSWESPARTVARLIRNGVDSDLAGKLKRYGLRFEWASRQKNKPFLVISLRLRPGPYQVLLTLPWLNETSEEIAQLALTTLASNPSTWTEVHWIHQGYGEERTPAIAGPGWNVQKFCVLP